MASKTYIWIEDRKGKSSYLFWETLMKHLFPEVIVESKKNNSELVKAVAHIKEDENFYIIVYDNSFDNLQLYQEQKRLKQYTLTKSNIRLMDIICFEYLLLEFENLIQWIYAPEDVFLEKRSKAIVARKLLVDAISSGEINYKAIREIIEYDAHLENHNIEQLSAKLLFDLTRNTGFEVSKGKIGDCWIKDCCNWEQKQENDVCGLNLFPLTVLEKMKAVYYGTCLHKKLLEKGLEVPAC